MLQTWTFPISQNVVRRFSVTFIEDRFCLFRTWSFTLLKNDLDPIGNSKFCFVVSNDELLWHCSSMRADNGCLRSIMSFFFFQNNVLGLLMRETWLELVCPCRRSDNGFLRSIIHQFISFPLLRRPSFVIVPPWVACWVRAFNKLFVVVHWLMTCVAVDNRLTRSILFLSFRTPGTLTFIAFLLRAFWRRRWQSWGSPCNKTHHWPWLRCDPFFTWFLLRSFWHHFRTNCRTEMADVEQTQRWFHSSRVNFPFVSMSASWFLVSIYLIWILGSKLIRWNNQSRATLWVLETCLIVGLLPFVIILITASLSSNTHNKASWCENWTFEGTQSTLVKTLNIPWDRLFGSWLVSRPTTCCSVLSVVWVVFSRTETIRSHNSRAGIQSNLNPASKEMISDSVELCETKVCFLHIQLIGTYVWLPRNAQCSSRNGFWVLKISRKIGVLKQYQSALFCSITHTTILLVFTCVMNVRYQSIQAFVTGFGPFGDWSCKFVHWP